MQLSSHQRGQLERARAALAASRNATDADTYAKHLGVLEVRLADMIGLVEQLTGPSGV